MKTTHISQCIYWFQRVSQDLRKLSLPSALEHTTTNINLILVYHHPRSWSSTPHVSRLSSTILITIYLHLLIDNTNKALPDIHHIIVWKSQSMFDESRNLWLKSSILCD